MFESKLDGPVKGIIALDFDETLFNGDLIKPEEINKLIEKAIKNNFIVVCITSRFPIDKIDLTLRTFFPKISSAFYTSAQFKTFILNHLSHKHTCLKETMALVDDSLDQNCDIYRNKFVSIPVTESYKYLSFLSKFIEGTLINDTDYKEFIDYYFRNNFYDAQNVQPTVSSETSEDQDISHIELVRFPLSCTPFAR